MNDRINHSLNSLRKSKFRSKFKLSQKNRDYIATKGLETIIWPCMILSDCLGRFNVSLSKDFMIQRKGGKFLRFCLVPGMGERFLRHFELKRSNRHDLQF